MVLPLRWKRLHDDIPDTSLEPYWENVSVSDERGGIFDGASCSQGANMTDFRAETYTKLLLLRIVSNMCMYVLMMMMMIMWHSKWFKRGGIFLSTFFYSILVYKLFFAVVVKKKKIFIQNYAMKIIVLQIIFKTSVKWDFMLTVFALKEDPLYVLQIH